MEGLICDENFRWSGIRTNLPGSHQLIHSDARISPETGLRKELTVLIYSQPSFDKTKDEGSLEIWDDDMQNCVHKIPPKFNSAVIFQNTDKSYHGVPKVNFERRCITFSILKNKPTSNRSKALFVSRPNDPKEVSIIGLERSRVKDVKS